MQMEARAAHVKESQQRNQTMALDFPTPCKARAEPSAASGTHQPLAWQGRVGEWPGKQ